MTFFPPKSAENSAEKLTRPKMATRKLASEKKIVSFPLLTHRQSISERKPIAGIDRVASRVPRPNGARKGLDFDDKPKATGFKITSYFYIKHFHKNVNFSRLIDWIGFH